MCQRQLFVIGGMSEEVVFVVARVCVLEAKRQEEERREERPRPSTSLLRPENRMSKAPFQLALNPFDICVISASTFEFFL